jgi:hypothetical protein
VRSFLAAVLCLVAIVAAAVAVPAFWVNDRVVDRDGFREIVAPLADNTTVQKYIADEITAQVSSQAPLVPDALIAPLAQTYTRSDNFQQDFADAMVQQHEWLFNEAKPEDEGRVMSLDLTGMVNRVIADVGLGGVEIEGPILVPLGDSAQSGLEAGRYHNLGDQIGVLAIASLVIAVIATLIALIVARRRGLVLLAVGFGIILGGIATWLLGEGVQSRALDEVSGADDSAREVADLIVDKVVNDMQNVGLIAVGAGVAVGAVGLLISVALERRRY